MKILVACEESQAVTAEMRRRGHEAYSCDTETCSGGHPEWHIKQDVEPLLNGRCCFVTMDGSAHSVWGKWDMIIAFPPCTYLTNAGSMRLRVNGNIDKERLQKAIAAKAFFMKIYNADCQRIAIENPIPGRIHNLPPYTQTTEPYYHGDPWKKKTCLWLKGIPVLLPTDIVIPKGLWEGATSSRRDKKIFSKYELKANRDPKMRAKTFKGIARAMAEQWA